MVGGGGFFGVPLSERANQIQALKVGERLSGGLVNEAETAIAYANKEDGSVMFATFTGGDEAGAKGDPSAPSPQQPRVLISSDPNKIAGVRRVREEADQELERVALEAGPRSGEDGGRHELVALRASRLHSQAAGGMCEKAQRRDGGVRDQPGKAGEHGSQKRVGDFSWKCGARESSGQSAIDVIGSTHIVLRHGFASRSILLSLRMRKLFSSMHVGLIRCTPLAAITLHQDVAIAVARYRPFSP